MKHDAAAFDAGVAEAHREIAAGRLRLFSGAPSGAAWARDQADTLRSRFGIEVTFTSDMVTEKQVAFAKGYNSVVESHVDGIWGKGALAAAQAEVQQRRKARYDAWVASQKTTGGAP